MFQKRHRLFCFFTGVSTIFSKIFHICKHVNSALKWIYHLKPTTKRYIFQLYILDSLNCTQHRLLDLTLKMYNKNLNTLNNITNNIITKCNILHSQKCRQHALVDLPSKTNNTMYPNQHISDSQKCRQHPLVDFSFGTYNKTSLMYFQFVNNVESTLQWS